MNRCLTTSLAVSSIAVCALLASSLAAFTPAASAQGLQRPFPKDALRGTLVVTAPPEVALDGRADRLSPGARIRNTQNMLTMSGSLIGQELTVNYVRESSGLIHEVWILSADEAREKRAGTSSGRNFLFSSEASTAPRDDGKTPFNQLPKYPQQ